MRKTMAMGLVLIIALGFILIGHSDVQAMNNESAAMLAGAIAIFGKPILNAIGAEIFYPTYTLYPLRTKVVYRTAPAYKFAPCYRPRSAYERGWCRERRRIQREQDRLEYQRGRDDARRYFSY